MIIGALALLVFKVIIQRTYATWGALAGGCLNGVVIVVFGWCYQRIAMLCLCFFFAVVFCHVFCNTVLFALWVL